jgi:hypothetical protein
MAFLRKVTQSLTIAVGLFVAVAALTVFLWPMLWPETRPDLLHRLARLPLLIVAGGAWGILCAAIARKAGWSARSCVVLPMITILATSILLAVVVRSAGSFQLLTFSALGWPIGMLCGKLVYPELSWKRYAVESSEQPTTLKLSS